MPQHLQGAYEQHFQLKLGRPRIFAGPRGTFLRVESTRSYIRSTRNFQVYAQLSFLRAVNVAHRGDAIGQLRLAMEYTARMVEGVRHAFHENGFDSRDLSQLPPGGAECEFATQPANG